MAARQVTSIATATFNKVGAGAATGLKATSGQPQLTLGGKPELLYMGGQYCPFCAAERWVLAAAVSRFGTLSRVRFIHSSPTDIYPSTPTLSFDGSHYTSKYLAFVPVEWYGEKPDPDVSVRLQGATAPIANFGKVTFIHGAVSGMPLGSVKPSEAINMVSSAKVMQIQTSPLFGPVKGVFNTTFQHS